MPAGSKRSPTFRRSPRLRRTPANATAKPSSFVRVALLGWFALTIGTMLLLRTLNIGLGQGSFAYQYSDMQAARMGRAIWLVPIGAIAVLSIAWSARRRRLAPWLA